MAKRSAKSEAELRSCLVGCAGACFAFGSSVALFFCTVSAARMLMQRVVLSMAYGADRYAAGLRLVKKDQLSDGSRLPMMYKFIWLLGMLICVVLVMFPYVRLLQYWGLLRTDDGRPDGHA